MPQVLDAPQPLLAYVAQTHTFRVTLHDRWGQESLVTVKTDSDRFCNVLAMTKALYPSHSVFEAWEIPA